MSKWSHLMLRRLDREERDRTSQGLAAFGRAHRHPEKDSAVNNIIYIVGLVVVVIAVLSFFGLR